MAFCPWVWCFDPCKHCGSRNVELMYLGSKNRLDGRPDSPLITKCKDCGKWSDMPIGNFEMPKDKMSEFMEAVIEISKNLKKEGNNKDKDYELKIKRCPFCKKENPGLKTQAENGLYHFYIECEKCGLRGTYFTVPELAIRLWNNIQIHIPED